MCSVLVFLVNLKIIIVIILILLILLILIDKKRKKLPYLSSSITYLATILLENSSYMKYLYNRIECLVVTVEEWRVLVAVVVLVVMSSHFCLLPIYFLVLAHVLLHVLTFMMQTQLTSREQEQGKI